MLVKKVEFYFHQPVAENFISIKDVLSMQMGV
jgi:hypothetical protein